MFIKKKVSLLLLTLVLFVGACKKPQPLQFKGFQDFSVKPMSFTESKVSFGIGVFNPNNFDIRVNHLDAAITVAGTGIGNFQLDSTFTLPAVADFVLPVELKVKNGLLLSNMLFVVGGDSLSYSLAGKVRAGRKMIMAEIPFSYSGHLNQSDFNGKVK